MSETKPNSSEDFPSLTSAFDKALRNIDPIVAGVLDRALDGREVTVEEAVELFETTGLELSMLVMVADELRRRAVGDIVTYVVNRNINFTNVCIKRCGFCAFSRGHREEEGYFLPLEEIVRRAKEAWDLGATEVCIQAGLPPKMDGYLYINICKAIKKELPKMHIHGFSPEEVKYGAVRSKKDIEDYLKLLKEAGVGSLPGTSAEILDDEVRDYISPGRITTREWVQVIKTAHKIGIRTTSTIMYGHVENSTHRAKHIALLREIQKETHGFTEFVPLSFVYWEAPMYKRGVVGNKRIEGVGKGADGSGVIKMHAISRLMLNNYIKNIQVSWVKEGPKLGQLCLNAGCNDLGGTLINESISTAAGASYGQILRPAEIRAMARGIGRIPAERSTTYKLLRIFDGEEEKPDKLDNVEYDETIFLPYQKLIRMKEHRFKDLFQHPTLAQETAG